jgi:hypothetical protein
MSSPSLVPVKLPQLSGHPFSQHNVFFWSFYVNKIYFPLAGLRSPVTQVGSHWQTPPTIFSIGGGRCSLKAPGPLGWLTLGCLQG